MISMRQQQSAHKAQAVGMTQLNWLHGDHCWQGCKLVLQEFERKEHKLKARAATNLAFLYSLEGDSTSAERYADLAVTTDKYSAQALVNKVS